MIRDGTRAPLAIRQTMDVRVAQTNLAFLSLSFQAARVSDYAFGSRPPGPGQSANGPIPIEQMQLNPPNLGRDHHHIRRVDGTTGNVTS